MARAQRCVWLRSRRDDAFHGVPCLFLRSFWESSHLSSVALTMPLSIRTAARGHARRHLPTTCCTAMRAGKRSFHSVGSAGSWAVRHRMQTASWWQVIATPQSEYLKNLTFARGRSGVASQVSPEGKSVQIADGLADSDRSGPQAVFWPFATKTPVRPD